MALVFTGSMIAIGSYGLVYLIERLRPATLILGSYFVFYSFLSIFCFLFCLELCILDMATVLVANFCFFCADLVFLAIGLDFFRGCLRFFLVPLLVNVANYTSYDDYSFLPFKTSFIRSTNSTY